MKTSPMMPWIEKGYELFSVHGPNTIRIEHLAKAVNINKSSFYHLFGDYEVFEEILLQHHIKQVKAIAKKLKDCKLIDPNQILVICESKNDMLFHRQLRIHRNNDVYKKCSEKSFSMVAPYTQKIWTKMLDKSGNEISPATLTILSDIFFQKITAENLSYDFIIQMISEIKIFLQDFIISNNDDAAFE